MNNFLLPLTFLLLILFCGCKMSTSSFKEGKFQYESHCASCHGKSGEGLGKWYPSLKDFQYIQHNRQNLARWIRFGISADSSKPNFGRWGQVDMPPNTILKDADICNILNYLNENFWKGQEFKISEIQKGLQEEK